MGKIHHNPGLKCSLPCLFVLSEDLVYLDLSLVVYKGLNLYLNTQARTYPPPPTHTHTQRQNTRTHTHIQHNITPNPVINTLLSTFLCRALHNTKF